MGHQDSLDNAEEQEQRHDAPSSDSCASARCSAMLEASEALDRIAVMRLQEGSDWYRCVDYFPTHDEDDQCLSGTKPIDATCRTKMASWCEQVVDFCHFSRETVSFAMSFLDRFVTAALMDGHPRAVSAQGCRKEYQLAAMTSLYIAVKLNEPVEMDTELVSELSRGVYSAQEVAGMEMDMLDALGWSLSGPTPLGFFSHFLGLFPAGCKQQAETLLLELGRRQTELAASDAALVPFDPSSIAIAALINSLEAVDESLMPPEDKIAFLTDVRNATDIDVTGTEVYFVRTRLLEAFASKCDKDIIPIQQESSSSATTSALQETSEHEHEQCTSEQDNEKCKSQKAKRRCSATGSMGVSRRRCSLGAYAA